MSQSTIFSGTFCFLGDHYNYFFNCKVTGIMLSAYAVFKSELNIPVVVI